MIRKMVFTILPFAVMVLVGCDMGRPERQSPKVYFDLAGLLEDLPSRLAGKHAEVDKLTWLNGREDSVHIVLDSTGWAKELKAFAEADINEAALRDAYAVRDGLTDPNSNLQVVAYTPHRPEGAKVDELRVYYLGKKKQVRKVQAKYKEQNVLFRHYHEIELVFEEVEGDIYLQSYQIKGTQKMLFQDTLEYRVYGRVSF